MIDCLWLEEQLRWDKYKSAHTYNIKNNNKTNKQTEYTFYWMAEKVLLVTVE